MSDTPTTTSVQIPDAISVADLAKRLDLSATAVITELMKNGVMATINELIDFETAAIVGGELGFTIEHEAAETEARPNQPRGEGDDEQSGGKIQDRPPVVTIMGHVDHGKTSLLDAIRATHVAGGEAGGITQHIGAYQVTKNDRVITFLDTPGHEAFSAIRAHGARMTDVAIIVVAADDGVKPQTKEAAQHAKTANLPIIVAINKVDKPAADVNRTKQQLAEIDLTPDDWGGDVPCVEVSAKSTDGIDKLLDMILLVTDIAKPSARFDGPARGLVIESHVQTGRGSVVTLLIQEGTLSLGDYIIVGNTYGKVRSLEDYRGQKIKAATPSMPAVVLGLKELPDFGNWFEAVGTEKIARDWLAQKAKTNSVKSLMNVKSTSASDLQAAVADGKVKELMIILKTDVAGSLESITQSLKTVGNEEVRVHIVASGLGDISENDINTANASNAIILGFNVSINGSINQLAKRNGVDFKLYRIIYELLDDVRDWLNDLLPPEIIETEAARLKVLGIFKVTKDQIVTGGKVEDGKIVSGLSMHVMRAKKVIGETKLLSLQKAKAVVKQVVIGDECGLVISRFTEDELKVGDELVFYTTESRRRTL